VHGGLDFSLNYALACPINFPK